jgi:hypothetical protein
MDNISYLANTDCLSWYVVKPAVPNIIKLNLETSLKSQASDWLKMVTGLHFSQSDAQDLRLVFNLSLMILGPVLKTNCNQRPLVDKYHSLFVPLTD